ncbi:MAG: IS5 family transposase, partial [bacterium]|nr:IS5 family transposase [bacterium]
MAARKSSLVNRKYKTKYRVANWSEYERGLRDRGDVTIWFSEEAIEAWKPPRNGRRGGQRLYSNLAILTSLTLRAVFHLALRQTEGFVSSLLRLMGLDLTAPDHTTLSRRNKDVEVPRQSRANGEPIHLIVDSSGLKIVGKGDWHVHKHRAKARRGWRKLHIGVDAEGYIVASELTESGADDANQVPDLLGQVDDEVDRFTADGAYDKKRVYEALSARQ